MPLFCSPEPVGDESKKEERTPKARGAGGSFFGSPAAVDFPRLSYDDEL